MSISSSFPSISPSLTLDFAKSKSLDPRVTFTRTQTGNIATYTGYDGLIKYAGPDEPRFDHRVTKRTNLLKYSQEIDFALNWTGSGGSTITADAVIAPDGSQTAEEIYISSWILQTYVDAEPSTTYTFSVWLKSPGDTQSVPIWFEETDKIAETTVTVTNEWQRFSLTGTSTSSPNNFRPSIRGPRTLYVWGAQLEVGSEPTEYIATDNQYTTRTKVESVGLLLETSRQNFITTSNMSNWSYIGFTGRSLDSVGPDGVANSAISLTEVTGTNPGQYVIYGDHNVSNNNQTFTHSVFVKPVSSYNWQLNVHNIGSAGNTSNFSVILNTNTRQFTTATGGLNSPTLEDYGYQELSGGWFRIWATCNVGNSDQTSSSLRFHVRPLNANQSSNYTGTGALTGYVFGAQIELGNYLTSYVPTSGSTITRPTDALSITGSENFSSFYNSTQWTLLVDQVASKQTFLSSPATVQEHIFDDSSGGNQYKIRFVSNTTNPYIDAYAQTNQSVVLDAPGDYTLWTNETVDVPIRTAFTCNQTTTKFCNNSRPVQIDGTFSLSSGVNRFRITSLRAGNVSKISYYPAALPSTQLQTLTAPKV